MTDKGFDVPPIGTQVAHLAAADPDRPAVSCQGRTLSRGELDRSTNSLPARTPNSVCDRVIT